jgi:hypothetical protein
LSGKKLIDGGGGGRAESSEREEVQKMTEGEKLEGNKDDDAWSSRSSNLTFRELQIELESVRESKLKRLEQIVA